MFGNKGEADENAWMEHKENFADWDANQMASYLKEKADLGEYYEMITQQKITGEVAPKLTDADLREMGIDSIGDRKRFMMEVEELAKEHRKKEREKVIWEGREELWFSCWDRCIGTCCGCSPVDPAEYKLTGTHLIITRHEPCRVGPIWCCCGHKYEIDNVDLTHITDADVHGVPAPCCQHVFCCGKPQDHINIKTTSDGDKQLRLVQGEGAGISRKVTNQVEEAQKIERD